MVIPIAYGAWDLLLADSQANLWKNYVELQMQSEGAKIRVLMNFLPAILLLIYRKEWKQSYSDYSFWIWIALGSIMSLFLVSYATTAVDRIALYFIPLQLVVFSRLPYLARKQLSPEYIKVLIILLYAAVLFVWLFFAGHSHCWIPYKNILFGGLLASMMVPGMIFMVPQFAIITKFDWMNSWAGLVIPHTANVFGLFLLRQSIEKIPKSLFEAIQVDGANDFQLLRIVVVPLVMPLLIILS